MKINRHILDNGLRLVHSQDESTQMVALNVLYNVGARDEHPEHTGFAHLFEHLMFGGSVNIPDLPDKELRELVNKPFSFFETTELRENVDFTDMDVVLDEPDIKETEDESIEEMIPEEKHLPEEEPVVFSVQR